MSRLKLSSSSSSAFDEYNDTISNNNNNSNNSNDNIHIGVLNLLTIKIASSYKKCNANFKAVDKLPQRMLTVPSIGVNNDNNDNDDNNLICMVHDKLISDKEVYIILDLLGTGTFGQVFRCQREGTKEVYAVKVIKNKSTYYNQGLLEKKILRSLNDVYDVDDTRHIVRLLESFEYKNHICLVFELLSMSLLDILTQNQFRGLPLSVVQRFSRQIIAALVTLEDANIIHCDLKPENILLAPPKMPEKIKGKQTKIDDVDTTNIDNTKNDNNTKSSDDKTSTLNSAAPSPSPPPSSTSNSRLGVWSDLKVIDFGSACYEGKTTYSYIQSRFYRSPEVLLGVPYNGAIDMWSLACVCAELYLGLPLFPGVSQHNQLTRMVEMLGNPPDSMIGGKNGSKYFTKNLDNTENSSVSSVDAKADSTGAGSSGSILWNINSKGEKVNSKFRIKTASEYAAETHTEVPVLRKYLRYSRLDEVIMKCPLANKSKMTQEQKIEEMNKRACFLNFLQGLFRFNPFERWTAKQAASHPFITNTRYTGEFQPPVDPKVNERKLAYLLATQGKTASISRNPSMTNQTQTANKVSDNSNKEEPEREFVPLSKQSRRLTEPVQRTNNIDNFEQGRPMLQRGLPAHDVNKQKNQISPMHSPSQYVSNLPIHMNVGPPGGHEMYTHSPQMYSAYSASSPGNWGHQQSFIVAPPVVYQQQQQIYVQDPNTRSYVNYPSGGQYIQAAPQVPIYPGPNMYGQMASSQPMYTHHIMPNGYMLAGTSPGMVPLMASSGSYGAVSMQEPIMGMTQMGQAPIIMTDFGQALTRPELDERRRLQSQQQHMQQVMVSSSYGHPSNLVRSFEQRSMELTRQRPQRRQTVAVPADNIIHNDKAKPDQQHTRRATLPSNIIQEDPKNDITSATDDRKKAENQQNTSKSTIPKSKEEVSDALADMDPFFPLDDET